MSLLDSNYFKIIGSKLYIDSSVLDFDMPSKTYSVRVNLVDRDNENTIVYRDHHISVTPCECSPTTTTTTEIP